MTRRFTRHLVGGWHFYTLHDERGDTLAYGKWKKIGTDAEIHVSEAPQSISIMKDIRWILHNVVMEDLKAYGCTTLVAADRLENINSTRKKYWKFFGFDFVTEVNGHLCAVMEVR